MLFALVLFLLPFHPSHAIDRALYGAALKKIDFAEVKQAIAEVLIDSKDFWPADYGHYGPLMVRMAWHCAGSYRTSDGRGGCNGGRIRFDPERSWPDNTNLDKARRVLWPVKERFGLGLSWGDLIVLTGTTAIEMMGGPTTDFCAGRIDDDDGSMSYQLGPTPEQARLWPCEVNGECKEPLGVSTVGLIYVNPGGPMGNPNPTLSAADVREVFGRMSLDDRETIALVGGGHAFGKLHGACPAGAGPSPKDQPGNPWPGMCGETGKGMDSATSGFEGPWTTTPTKWSNQYFRYMKQYKDDWELYVSPGGANQWRLKKSSPASAEKVAPAAHGSGNVSIVRLTADLALLHDPEGEYQKLVDEYASDLGALERDFAYAWYKLVNRDMGPPERCGGNLPHPSQDWQNAIVPGPQPDYAAVKASVQKIETKADSALFVQLAWRSASTFRVTDNLGGANGARIRFAPQADWTVNAGMQDAIELLAPVKAEFGAKLSWADLIVIAGQVAIEDMGGVLPEFCGGRGDAEAGAHSDSYLTPRIFADAADQITEGITLSGLSAREYIALQGKPRSPAVQQGLGFSGAYGAPELSNSYFKLLLNEQWEETETEATTTSKTRTKAKTTGATTTSVTTTTTVTTVAPGAEYKASGKDLYMVGADVALLYNDAWKNILQEFAANNDLFLSTFASAWTKVVEADRFDGPTGNICADKRAATGQTCSA